jgi:hypothetical protein
MLSEYAPTGSGPVKDAKGLAAGDSIRLRWPRTAQWIHFMEMDTLARNGKSATWMKDDSEMTMPRPIRSDPLKVALPLPVGDCVVESRDFQARRVDIKIDDGATKGVPREFAGFK